ncbi:MAG: polysaccharide biosynthesis/export family protein, partial [Planctomycetia bacterium]|nr:polysaccharide biosynthesis/export family protein [Planctomycetia bacterium]
MRLTWLPIRFLAVLVPLGVVALAGCQAVNFHDQTLDEPVPAAIEPPRELAMRSLPEYRIEPPDVLQIELLKLVPQPPYRIESYDVLTISALNTFLDQPIQGYFLVEAEGTVNLGPAYGSFRVAGMSVEEAQLAIKAKLMNILREPEVSVQLARASGMQPVTGPYLVGQDGTVNLRQYGAVYVAGKTLTEAKLALEKQLSAYVDSPEVSVDIAAYNSKVYYIITEGGGQGDNVVRLPVTGNETVLDAVSQIQGLSQLSSKSIWIARPSPAGFGCEQILPVDWDAITRGGMTATNYQLMPGDRVFIAADPMIALTTTVSKMIGPFERLLGFSSLTFSTVRSAQMMGVRSSYY